jgi:hypothetical protein
MLTEDAAMEMPPTAAWFDGCDAVIEGLRTWPLSAERSWRLQLARFYGQPAVAAYRRETSDRYELHHLMVMSFSGRTIAELTAFLGIDPERLRLPREL